jgi:hypothetical protein
MSTRVNISYPWPGSWDQDHCIKKNYEWWNFKKINLKRDKKQLKKIRMKFDI